MSRQKTILDHCKLINMKLLPIVSELNCEPQTIRVTGFDRGGNKKHEDLIIPADGTPVESTVVMWPPKSIEHR